MFRHLKKIYGIKLHASDGDIGKISDFYFDDESFAIRYVVADTGTWLSERQVLLAPNSFGWLDPEEEVLKVNLTKEQIEGSPLIALHRPVSRQDEEDYLSYYGWPYYWTGSAIFGFGGYSPPPEISAIAEEAKEEQRLRDDPHLQSTQGVTGYAIEASDGTIGHVRDFLAEETSWVIQHFEVETGHWYAGKEILISTDRITRISYSESKVYVNLTKADIERTGDHHIVRSQLPITHADAEAIHRTDS